jgi:hypothetical protein
VDHFTASGSKPLRFLIGSSNIDPGAVDEMKVRISGQRHNSIEAHWWIGVFW